MTRVKRKNERKKEEGDSIYFFKNCRNPKMFIPMRKGMM